MYNLAELRQREFPLSAETLYFSHASISPLPQRTVTKVQWAAERLAENPMRHWITDGRPMFKAFGEQLAAYINAASPDEVVPSFNTSFGVNSIAQALPLERGDNLVFCDLEFPSNAYPWMSREREGIEIRKVPAVNGGMTLETLAKAVDERTKLVAVSAVQFFSGHRSDLAALGAFCRERGIWFFVDAIQAIGHIKIDVQAMQIDMLAAGGQKSLMAPPGTGFLYVREAVAEQLIPRLIFSDATRNWEFWLDYDLTPLPGAARFHSSTPNLIGMFGLLESLSLINELGIEAIDQHTTALAAEAIERVAKLGYQPITPREEHSAIVTFATGMSEEDSSRLVAFLDEHNVIVVKHWSPQRVPHLRLSFHCYNTKEELDQFEAIIKDFRI